MARVKIIPGSEPTNEGERRTIEHLSDQLPSTYTVIPNLEISQRGAPPLEYDAVVIAPHAVYVIETKDWHGKIVGDDYEWALNGETRPSPYKSTNYKAKVLKSEIERRTNVNLWVQAVIIVVDDRTTLQLNGSVRQWTANLNNAPALLTDRKKLDATGYSGDFRREHTKLVEAVLASAGVRERRTKQFGDYRVSETVSVSDVVSEYKARNTALGVGGDTFYRLRVFAYDPYLNPDQLIQRQAIIRREARALQRIGKHPNIVALRSFFTDTLDPNLFVAVLDWSTQPTLRSKLQKHQSGEQTIAQDELLLIVIGILKGLKAAHTAGIIHRDIRPENIHFDNSGIPCLANFDYAKLPNTDSPTLHDVPREPGAPRQYQPPELFTPPYHAIPASDLYGVGVILYEFFAGQAFFDSPEQAREENTILSPKAIGIDIPDALDDLIRRLAHPNPAKRPQDAAEAITILERIIATMRPQPESEPAVFKPGDVIDGEYQVLEVLGGGGSGQMYKVYQALPDTEFALKVFHPASFALTAIQREIRALLDINKRNNPHIVRVINAKTLPSGRYYLVSEFVKGKNLTHYTKPDGTRLPIQQSVQLIDELLLALEAIHPNIDQLNSLRKKGSDLSAADAQKLRQIEEAGWIHRDIKPANLILSPEGIKLVDFNIAVRVADAGHTYIGTPEYMMPGVGSQKWETDADLFAVGIVLYELVTGHHPYPNRQPTTNVSPDSPLQYIPNLHHDFVELMLRAISGDPDKRFRSAKQFRNALEGLQGTYFTPTTITTPHEYEIELDDWEYNKPNYNPYVTRLLRLYSQAMRDNSGTRGFDQIAQLTYVRTRLDTHLGAQVLAGKHRLVIITGNAGDGKTAFIQSLEAKVKQENVFVEKLTENASTFIYEGRTFVTNYDGSQDEGEERANDLVLGEFFYPFNDEDIDQVDETANVQIIAINQGRLMDFFTDTSHFKQLGELIDNFFDPPSESYTSPDWLLIVDLNQRSMVASDPDQKNKSILERQIETLLHPALWESCNGCDFRHRCSIKYNVDVLSDTASGSVVRERLHTLFEIVHLRRQLHITMRDMRSALAWMLFRDHDCDEIAQVIQQGTPPEQLDLLLYNAFAADSHPAQDSADDRLVRLLREIDPAQVANPTLDRGLGFYGLSGIQRIAFEKRTDDLPKGIADTWKTSIDQTHPQISTDSGQYTAEVQQYVRGLRRIAYFERRDDGWLDMLPYRKLALFRQATRGQNTDELKTTIANGISIIEGAEHQNRRGEDPFIFIRAGNQNKVRLKSFRLFPLQEFTINIPGSNQSRTIEYTPDQIVFYYDFKKIGTNQTNQRPPELHLSLDLLEMLYQAEEGYVLSTDDLGGVAIYLNMFKNALAHLPYKTIRLQYEEGGQFNLIHEGNAALRLSQVEGEEGQE